MSQIHLPKEDEANSLQAQVEALQQEMRALRAQMDARPSRIRSMVVGMALVLSGTALTAGAQAVGDSLKVFSANTPALASDVNFNFSLIKAWIENKLGSVDEQHIRMANQAVIASEDTNGNAQNVFWPRAGDNATYLNYGTGGFNLRNNASTVEMSMTNTGVTTFRKGVKFDCPDCGDSNTLDGAADWGDLTIQGRVLSASNNIHLSPPAGFDVVINDVYRAAGGAGNGTPGLQVEGDLTVQGKTLANHIRDYVRTNCYLSFGWRDSCDGGCDGSPSKYGSTRADGTCGSVTGGDSECSNSWVGINTDGDVNGDDKFYAKFVCN